MAGIVASTPLGNKNLRRSVLLRNENANRRRISVVNQSFVATEEVDDELERSQLRNSAELQKRLSNISSPKSPQLTAANEKDMKDHFQICLKMYAENKITVKNAWNLKIIDYMKTVLHSEGLTKNSLQVASTSLDASAKIYGIRVDDIHAEGLKLASNMARVNAQTEDNAEDHEDNEEGDKENEAPKKKKKRHLMSGPKTTVAKDPKSLLADIPKLESVFFQTRTNLEASGIDNLFTSKMPMNSACYKFMLLGKEKAWPTYKATNKNVSFDKSSSFKVKPVKNLQICVPFKDFEIDEWDPDQEEEIRKKQNQFMIEDEVVYDDQGIPIPELDGSIHDVFANAGAENQYASSEEDEGRVAAQDMVVTNTVAHIIDFRPEERGVCANEYSYSNTCSINVIGNKLMTQVWAGPSHWKLKHIRRTLSRFSGQAEKQQAAKSTRKARVQPDLIDFFADAPGFDKSKQYKGKKSRVVNCPTKCTLPQFFFLDKNPIGPLRLRPVFISNDLNKPEKDAEDPEVGPYNYENPNDSMYCSQNGFANDDNDDHGDFDADHHEGVAMQQLPMGDNLIDAPETVPQTYIPYALQAKKMDMRKLKVAVWKSIVSQSHEDIIPDEDMYQRPVPSKKFSEVYKNVPKRITEKMRQELSCPLAFVALLHLANEQNLMLKGQSDLSDFNIEQVAKFVS